VAGPAAGPAGRVRGLAEPTPEATEDLRVHLVPVDRVGALVEASEVVQALHVAPLLAYLLARRG
jgi:hypothetical protein